MVAEIPEKIGRTPQNILPTAGASVPLGERVGEAWHLGANGRWVQTSGFALGGRRVPPKLGAERRDPLDKRRTLAGDVKRYITAHAVAEERRRSDLVAVKQLDHVLGEVLHPKGAIARRSRGVSLKVELVNAKARSKCVGERVELASGPERTVKQNEVLHVVETKRRSRFR
jgi:hypothetical protein